MKIIYRKGDVTETNLPYILHGCNAQGVMGSGVAKAIREKFPKAYADYSLTHKRTGLNLGCVYPSHVRPGLVILNAITQDLYGTHVRQVDYEAVYSCLEDVNEIVGSQIAGKDALLSAAMPRIGAGLGGGNWRIIETMIEETSTDYQPVVYDL